jgi:diadenosine tetraphosphate (Ap4A) HIT family hydrolase
MPKLGWVTGLQSHLESPLDEGRSDEPIACRRGVIEDASWFLVLERNPLTEGHCKLICKEHVWDLMELGEWANRDQRIAAVRDSLSRALVLSIEVIMAIDPRIVDVTVVSGLEHGSHLHFDLIPRYRMDLPGLRPLASSRAYYDDLSLVRKRRLWETRKKHLEEVANRLRSVAARVLATRGAAGTRVTTFGEL